MNEGIREVIISEKQGKALLEATLGLPAGIYANRLELRGAFLARVREQVVPIIGDSNWGRRLEELQQGEAIAVIARELPLDPSLPSPPVDGGTPVGKTSWVSEGLASAVAEILGVATLLLEEKEEATVHQITPVRGREETQSNEGTVELKLHQDLAPIASAPSVRFDLFMPDYLVLQGVRGGEGNTETYVALTDTALKLLSADIIAVLKERRFVTNPPDSFVKKHGDAFNYLPIHPILAEHNGRTEMILDTSSNVRPCDPQDQEAAAALAELVRSLNAVKRAISIRPGVQVAFNNRRLAHGRGAVRVEMDRRWIQRVYAVDPIRLVKTSMHTPCTPQLGGGIATVSSTYVPERVLELAS